MALLLLVLFCGGQIASAFVPPHHHHSRINRAERPCPSLGNSDHKNCLLSSSSQVLDSSSLATKVSTANTINTRLHLFGNLFGNEVEEDQKDLQENELARFSHLISTDDNPSVKFDSLSIMISEWSKLFTDVEKKMGLTTPVALVEFPRQENLDGEVTNYSGVQLLFQKGKTGGRSAYQDKDDDKYNNKKEKDGGKEETIKEGGVEVRVEQLTGGELQVIASRCEIEEGTMVKEMSEQTIIDSLRKAMAAWKKEQAS